MTVPPITVTPLETYRNETPYPFCPGCGHGPILDRLNEALTRLAVDPSRVVLVSDIGCSGLSDQYFGTNAFHGLHGRSLTYATGIKLARPDLKVVVIMGDGGAGIGAAHLLAAARRNIGLTLLVFNNFNFGMTGGQHSATTPLGAETSSTPWGNLERPLDIAATAAANGAGYVFRGTTFDPDLGSHIAAAMRRECFAVLDIWELCTAHYVPRNRLSRKALQDLMDEVGFETGLLHEEERPEYAAACRERGAAVGGLVRTVSLPLETRFASPLSRPLHLLVAGSAGGKVRSATRCLARAGLLSGLWATQRDDYPVTVKTGHSASDLVLSPDEILHAGGGTPDAVLLVSGDGARYAARHLEALPPHARVFTLPPHDTLRTSAVVERIEPGRAAVRPTSSTRALMALAAVARRLEVVPEAALAEAARRGSPQRCDANLAAIAAGWALPA